MTSTASGIVGAIGWPVASIVCVGCVRPRVVTITPVGEEHAGDQLRLGDEAAAVVAQVEHDPP